MSTTGDLAVRACAQEVAPEREYLVWVGAEDRASGSLRGGEVQYACASLARAEAHWHVACDPGPDAAAKPLAGRTTIIVADGDGRRLLNHEEALQLSRRATDDYCRVLAEGGQELVVRERSRAKEHNDREVELQWAHGVRQMPARRRGRGLER
jgi:hypothetical protein